MKKISVFMVVMLLFCLSSPICLAQANPSDYSRLTTSNEAVTPEMESFINFISVFFESNNTFAAIDFDGNDISDEFYNSYAYTGYLWYAVAGVYSYEYTYHSLPTRTVTLSPQ